MDIFDRQTSKKFIKYLVQKYDKLFNKQKSPL